MTVTFLTVVIGYVALYNNILESTKIPNEEAESEMSVKSTDFSQMLVSEVNYMNASTKIFLSSPSLVRLNDTTLLASHDYSGPNSPHRKTSVYRSANNGKTWEHIVMLDGIYWASLFLHNGHVYLLGTSGPLESIVIRKSEDGGTTWTTAADSGSGLLFPGGSSSASAYHTAPTPVLRANGRIYKAFESNVPFVWPQNFKALVISAPETADLLNAANWTKTNELAYQPSWAPAEWASSRPGWLEGNMVQTPGGDIWNVIRLNSEPVVDKAAIIKLSADNQSITFDPASGFIDFPGGMHKFTIRYDEASQLYVTLVNDNSYPSEVQQRNMLSLYTSPDLLHWNFVKRLITDDSGISVPYSIAKVGFQYADWQFDGKDIIFIARTSYDGADTYHNANRITFHRIKNVRNYFDLPEGYWKFDEDAESIALDSSIHGVQGTVQGAKWTAGYINGALAFDGDDDYVLLDDSLKTNLQGSPAITIAGWFKNDGLPLSGQEGNWLFGIPSDQTMAGAELFMAGKHIRVGGRSKTNEDYKYKDFPFSASGEWHHAVGLMDYEHNEIRLYLDGVEQKPTSTKPLVFGSRSYSPGNSGLSARIGSSPFGTGFFGGVIDEVKVYGRALSPSEIQHLVYDGLKGYWKLDASSGNQAADSSRYQNNGKLMGTSSIVSHPEQGIRLDGDIDYFSLGYKPSAAINGAPAITITGWFYDRNIPDSNPKWLFGTRIHGGTAGAELTLTGTAIRVAGRSDVSDGFKTKSFPYAQAARWRHVVGILDFENNNIRLFLDGLEQSSSSGPVQFNSRSYKRLIPSQTDSIGRSPGGNGYFGGDLGNFFLFGKALSSSEIEHLYLTQKKNY